MEINRIFFEHGHRAMFWTLVEMFFKTINDSSPIVGDDGNTLIVFRRNGYRSLEKRQKKVVQSSAG